MAASSRRGGRGATHAGAPPSAPPAPARGGPEPPSTPARGRIKAVTPPLFSLREAKKQDGRFHGSFDGIRQEAGEEEAEGGGDSSSLLPWTRVHLIQAGVTASPWGPTSCCRSTLPGAPTAASDGPSLRSWDQ